MRLGNRLTSIAAMIPKGATVIDIGTDHAYLPIYLIDKGISRKVIATEKLIGPYKKAYENIKKAGYIDYIELRMGNGLKPIKQGEGDVAVMAGMGATTIINILDESRNIADFFEKIILQPMVDIAELRTYLFAINYEITEENVAKEGQRYYEVIAARKSHRTEINPLDKIDIFVGPILRNKKDLFVFNYFNHRIGKLENLINIISCAESLLAKNALKRYKEELEALREVIK